MAVRIVEINRVFTIEGDDESDLDFVERNIRFMVGGVKLEVLKNLGDILDIKVTENNHESA